MDYVQALFSFFIAPLFGTVILGMLWKRATGPAAFWGLLLGTLSSITMWVSVKLDPTVLHYVALSAKAKPMAQDMFQALWSFVICVVVTVAVSLITKAKTDAELEGLVYGLTAIPSLKGVALYQRPIFWAGVVTVVFVGLNIIFW
jgi:SSS family solute:Na+ symporter